MSFETETVNTAESKYKEVHSLGGESCLPRSLSPQAADVTETPAI